MSTATETEPIRSLYCACCGARTEGRQFSNQDAGHGLCPPCSVRIEARWNETDDYTFARCYGTRGYHFDVIDTRKAST
jgi:hypothetical protein